MNVHYYQFRPRGIHRSGVYLKNGVLKYNYYPMVKMQADQILALNTRHDLKKILKEFTSLLNVHNTVHPVLTASDSSQTYSGLDYKLQASKCAHYPLGGDINT